jgi:hypothetical protein
MSQMIVSIYVLSDHKHGLHLSFFSLLVAYTQNKDEGQPDHMSNMIIRSVFMIFNALKIENL